MKKIVTIMLALALCIGICACGAKANDIEDYVGNTYSGTSPWGENVSVTVEKYDPEDGNGSVDLAYVENVDSDHQIQCTLNGNKLDDNSLNVTVAGSQDGDYRLEYEYELKLVFTDGDIEMTYHNGQKTELSDQGGSGFHQVGALNDADKTIVLKKK